MWDIQTLKMGCGVDGLSHLQEGKAVEWKGRWLERGCGGDCGLLVGWRGTFAWWGGTLESSRCDAENEVYSITLDCHGVAIWGEFLVVWVSL